MAINATVTPAQFAKIKQALPLDKLNAKKKAIKWFIDNLLIEHFQAGNTAKYGYTPNSPKYQEWKRKHGLDPNVQLVLSGRLKQEVLRSAKVTNKATLRVSVPEYGIYQIELGRDFLEPNSSELRLLNKQYKKFLQEIRQKTVKTIVGKY